MKRKTLFVTIPFIISLFVISYSFIGFIIFSSAAFLILLLFLSFRKIIIKQSVLILLSWILAIVIFLPYNNSKNNFIDKYTHGTYEFSGEIKDIKEHSSDKASYTISGKFKDGDKAVLSLYTDNIGGEYGDIINLTSDFSVYENNYLFSSANYNLGKGIYIQSDKITQINLTPNSSFKNKIIRELKNYRKFISSKIIHKFGKDNGGVINAMMFGDKTNLDDNEKTAFYRTGIGHVMAISGLHLIFLISIFGILFKRLKIPRIITFIISIILIIVFSICVDSPVSVIRAGIMIVISKQGELLFRKNDSFNSLSLCVFFMLIFHPYLAFSSSFLLSVSGTYGISVAAPFFTKNLRKYKNNFNLPKTVISFISMFTVSLCVFPVSAMFFNETSLVSPITNIFLVPVCMFVLLLSFIIFFTYGNDVISVILYPFIKYPVLLIRKTTDFMSDLSFSHISLGNKNLVCILFLLTALIFVAYLIFKSTKITALAVAFSILFTSGYYLGDTIRENNYVKIAILGDKQNCVSIVSYEGNTFVFDLTGKSSSADYARKYLEQKGLNKVTALVLCKNQAYSASLYNETYISSKISTVIIPEKYSKWICGSDINKTSPSFIDGTVSIDFKGIKLESTDNNLSVLYKNTNILIAENIEDITNGYDVVYLFGKKINVYSDIEATIFAPYENTEINPTKIKYFYKHNHTEIFESKDPVETFEKINYYFSPTYRCNFNLEFLIDENGKIIERSIK